MQYTIYRVTAAEGQTKLALAATKSDALKLARRFHEEARADGCAIVRTALRRFVARIITEQTFQGRTYPLSTPLKVYAYEPMTTGTHDGVCLSWSVNRKSQRVAILAVLAENEAQTINYCARPRA